MEDPCRSCRLTHVSFGRQDGPYVVFSVDPETGNVVTEGS